MNLRFILKELLIFLLLTIITQVGGLVYLTYKLTVNQFKKRGQGKYPFLRNLFIFLLQYLFFTLVIIPPIAKQFGRVPMSYFATKNQPLKPLTIFTCLLNRHYVKPILKEQIIETAKTLAKEFPNTELIYLDANFPFWNGFPLLPHLSHNDGKKLDLAFMYKDKITGKGVNGSPSFYGYGVYEGPRKRELNQPNICHQKGYWQYSFLEKITPQWSKEGVVINEQGTKRLIQLLAQNKAIKKIFIEPHLKTRWGLERYNKIRYHGCQAVRHDDHIHVQL